MKTNRLSVRAILAGILCSVCSISLIHADSVNINFDSVDTSSGPVDATNYLASFGVTLSGENPAGTVDIFSDQAYYGNNFVVASSENNFLFQSNNSQPNTYTLTFASPLESFGFTRIAYSSAGDGLLAGWSADAYSGATLLDSVSEPYGAEFGGKPAALYTLSGDQYITSVTFSANGFGVAGVSSAPIDNLVLTTPEPSSWALGLLAIGTFFYLRRRALRA